MFPTVEEHQGMARAVEADRMQNHGPRHPGEYRRTSLNRFTPNGEVRHSRPTRPEPDRPLSVVYWPNSVVAENGDPSHLDPRCITHLIYTAAKVAYDGTVQLSDDIDMGSRNRANVDSLEACRSLRNRNPSLKVIISLGGNSPDALRIIADSEVLSRKFGNSARLFVSQFDLDGIELDWTHVTNQREEEALLKLTATAEGYLGMDHNGRSFQLGIALPGSHHKLNLCRHMGDVSRLVDFINVHTFDLPAPPMGRSYYLAPAFVAQDQQIASASPTLRSSTRSAFGSDRQASLYSVATLLEMNSTNMRKVTLGIPCFGVIFRGASGPGQQFSTRDTVPHNKTPLSNDAENIIAETGVAYSCIGEDSFVSYDLPATVSRKAELIRNKNMAGFCYGNATDDSKDDRSLIRNGFAALTSG